MKSKTSKMMKAIHVRYDYDMVMNIIISINMNIND